MTGVYRPDATRQSPTRPPRRSVTARNDVTAATWRAFEQAVSDACTLAAPNVAADDLAVFVAVFPAAVHAAVQHGDPTSETPQHRATASARALIESTRRRFIEMARDTVDPRGALTVLAAMGEVQATLDSGTAPPVEGEVIDREGLRPTVEIAHDIRSPLTAILFLVDMVRTGRSGSVTPVQARQLGMVYSAALGLNHLACDLIDLVRGADRLLERDHAAFSIAELLQGVHDIVQPIAEEKGLEIRIVSPERDARVGNPTALSRILLNLAANSAKFTSEGHVELRARDLGDDRVEFSVRDTGPGIPRHALPQLFRAFRRTETGTSSAFSSAGLGLSICQRLAEALGTELQVITSPSRGTCFRFELTLPSPTAG